MGEWGTRPPCRKSEGTPSPRVPAPLHPWFSSRNRVRHVGLTVNCGAGASRKRSLTCLVRDRKGKKVAHTRLPSVGFRSWSRFLAVSLQVTWIVNPTAGLLPESCYQFCCLVNRGAMGVNSLPKTVTRQRRSCDLNLGRSASESSMLTIRVPSHPVRHAIK